MTTPQTIVVIGAGICGLSSAIWLRRAGHHVTLIDRDYPGAGASYGNAGLLAEWAIVPVNTPGIVRSAAQILLAGQGPLFMRWTHLPRMMPWLLRFAANATDAKTRETARHLTHLVHDSVDQHRALTKGTIAEKWLASSDLGYVYKDRAAYDADHYGWSLKRDAGYVPEIFEGDAIREVEPMISPAHRCLAMLRGHGHVLNPGAYMADLAQVLQDEGGTYLQAEMRDVTLSDGRITQVMTDKGSLPCDRAVLSAGIWSKQLMAKLGLKTQLEAERGYHLQFTGASQKPRCPLMIQSGKFAVTPMEHGLRCAGTVELGGIDAGPSAAPVEMLKRKTAEVFPDLTYDKVDEWLGLRPSTPDSIPLIGEIGGTGVFAAFGHQHVGLTGGPKTGRWVADLISGRQPNQDLAAFSANRFS